MATSPSSPGSAGRSRRPGGVDVAKLAGVSQKTVSRVFNNERHVTDEVRDRVLAAARDLGYRPNGAARALNTGRTYRIGVATCGTALFGPLSLLVSLEREARSAGYAMSVANTFAEDPGGMHGAVQSLLEQGVDAVIISDPIDMHDEPLVIDVPVLTLGMAPPVTAPVVLSVKAAEGGDAAAAATTHLLELGHRTVHHVAGPQQYWSARERRTNWSRVLRAHSAEVPTVLEGDWSADSGYDVGRRLAGDPDVTAIFAANDEMAIGVMHALSDAGRSIPDDVSIVGFDDIPAAAHLMPPLTTLSSDNAVLAAIGLGHLIGYLNDPDTPPAAPPAHVHRLVVRRSTAPPSWLRKEGSAAVKERKTLTG
jgi:DNA-binding LacI/PurR family transcriptional regulator